MNRTKIEYLDYTWNPTAGCDGLGCAVGKNCWARKMAKRLGRYCDICPSFVPHVHFDRFEEPLQVKKPSIIGTSFMGDFFSKGISDWVRWDIYLIMEKADWHTFVILTKQPQNIWHDEDYPANLWIGVSVNRKEDLWRIDTLRHVPDTVRIVSFEPLYEELDPNLDGIDWVIIGGQTNPRVLPSWEWVQTLIQLAKNKRIPVFIKDTLEPIMPSWPSFRQYPTRRF